MNTRYLGNTGKSVQEEGGRISSVKEDTKKSCYMSINFPEFW